MGIQIYLTDRQAKLIWSQMEQMLSVGIADPEREDDPVADDAVEIQTKIGEKLHHNET